MTVWVLVCPTVTLPKLNEAGAMETAGCVPVPWRGIETVELVASLVAASDPEAFPALCGANLICTVALWPTGTDMEELPPTKLKPAPETATCDTFTVAVPVFVTLKLWVTEVPTGTFPKPMLVGLADNTPAAVCPPADV